MRAHHADGLSAGSARASNIQEGRCLLSNAARVGETALPDHAINGRHTKKDANLQVGQLTLAKPRMASDSSQIPVGTDNGAKMFVALNDSQGDFLGRARGRRRNFEDFGSIAVSAVGQSGCHRLRAFSVQSHDSICLALCEIQL